MPQGSERPRREDKRALFPPPVRNDDIASSTYLAVKHHDLVHLFGRVRQEEAGHWKGGA